MRIASGAVVLCVLFAAAAAVFNAGHPGFANLLFVVAIGLAGLSAVLVVAGWRGAPGFLREHARAEEPRSVRGVPVAARTAAPVPDTDLELALDGEIVVGRVVEEPIGLDQLAAHRGPAEPLLDFRGEPSAPPLGLLDRVRRRQPSADDPELILVAARGTDEPAP